MVFNNKELSDLDIPTLGPCNDWASEASPTWAIHLGFFIYYYYILLSYVRRGLCDPPFFFFGVRCAQYKVHAQCSFAALAPHMPWYKMVSLVVNFVIMSFNCLYRCA